MSTFKTATGIELEIQPVQNKNAIQTLMADAGIFDRVTGKLSYKKDVANVVKDWNRLFAYVIMNGVVSEPGDGDIEELAALGFGSASPSVLKLNWIRYGKSNSVDILTTQKEAAKLVMEILSISFLDKESDDSQDDDDD